MPIYPTNSFLEFSKEEIEQLISQRFEQQVCLNPNQIAIKSGDEQLSYENLNCHANRVAWTIFERTGDTQSPVLLFLEQGVPLLVGTLGVLKAGRFYVTLDPSNPPLRNLDMLQDSKARIIVTNNQNLALTEELCSTEASLLNIDLIGPENPDGNPTLSLSPDSLAYVLYTSGSTGQPKGVRQNHRNVLHNVMRHTNAFHICSNDQQSLLYPCSVYGGTRDIFNALLSGATLRHFSVQERGITSLGTCLIREEVTIYCSVATFFRHFIETLTENRCFPKLRLIKLGGEATRTKDVELFIKHFGHDCLLHCGFGATETGLARNFFINKHSQITDTTVPLGFPVEDMHITLLNEENKPQQAGEVGEIAVQSPYIACGYWQKSDSTMAVFSSLGLENHKRIYRTGVLGILRTDGCLEHRGRKDFQVKIRGNRVEFGEVEQMMLTLENIKEAVVVCRNDVNKDPCLLAFIVPRTQPPPHRIRGRRFRKLHLLYEFAGIR